AHRFRCAIPFERPRVDDLAALLLDVAERMEGTGRRHSVLLLELTLRRGERVFAFFRLPLGDGPGAQVLLRPERAAGMDEEHLERAVLPPVHQEAGAGARHGPNSTTGRRAIIGP